MLEAKTRLSELLTQVQQGQEFTITRHGVAVARLMPMAAASTHAARSPKAAVDAAFAALDTLRTRRDIGRAAEGRAGVGARLTRPFSMPFVLDNSVVSGGFPQNQAGPHTAFVASRLRAAMAFVPAIWPLELANVLRTACVRQPMTAAQAQAVVAQINPLQITVDSQPVSPAELLALSLRFALSAHDASCLELALCLQCPTATQDEDLRPAAQVSGVGVMASA